MSTLDRKTSAGELLAWTALSTIFLSGIYVHTPWGNMYFSYGVMVVSYVMLVARTGSLGLRREYVGFLMGLVGLSLLNFLVTSGKYGGGVQQVAVSLAKSSLMFFFVLFFTSIYNVCGRSVERTFGAYLRVAQAFAVLGVLQQVVFVLLHVDVLSPLASGSKHMGNYLGIAGLSVEPAFYACALLPAGAYHMSIFVRRFSLTLGGGLILLAILFSTSSLGYLGLFVAALLTFCVGFSFRRFWVLLLSVPLVVGGAYKLTSLEFFQLRWNDTVSVLQGGELTMADGMNLSTYSNAVNSLMALRSVRDNQGFGVGFGMYSVVFDKYIGDYEIPAYREDIPGRGSATSLFARLTAEIGVVAWVFFCVMLFWIWRSIRRGVLVPIAIAYVSTLSIILLRMGEYYANGVVLVFLMIYFIYLHANSQKNAASGAGVKNDGR